GRRLSANARCARCHQGMDEWFQTVHGSARHQSGRYMVVLPDADISQKYPDIPSIVLEAGVQRLRCQDAIHQSSFVRYETHRAVCYCPVLWKEGWHASRGSGVRIRETLHGHALVHARVRLHKTTLLSHHQWEHWWL